MKYLRNIVLLIAIILVGVIAIHDKRDGSVSVPALPVSSAAVYAGGTQTPEAEKAYVAAHPLGHPIETVDDLKVLVSHDSALAAFYAAQGFDVSCAEVSVTDRAHIAIASWRHRNEFGFAVTPVTIGAGETVFTSCGSPDVFLRGKCGNVMKFLVEPPVDTPTPDTAQIPSQNAPQAPPDVPRSPIPPVYAYTPPILSPPPDGPPGDVPPYSPPIFCCGGGSPPSTPTPVPEPAGLELMLVGIAIIFGVRKMKNQ